jgi:hypothetical protein
MIITYKRLVFSTSTSTWASSDYDDSTTDTCTNIHFYNYYNGDIVSDSYEIIPKPRYRPPRAPILSIPQKKKIIRFTRPIRIGREKYPSGKNFCKSPSRSSRQLKIRI